MSTPPPTHPSLNSPTTILSPVHTLPAWPQTTLLARTSRPSWGRRPTPPQVARRKRTRRMTGRRRRRKGKGKGEAETRGRTGRRTRTLYHWRATVASPWEGWGGIEGGMVRSMVLRSHTGTAVCCRSLPLPWGSKFQKEGPLLNVFFTVLFSACFPD